MSETEKQIKSTALGESQLNPQTHIRIGLYEPENLVEGILEMPVYELSSDSLKIHDVVWGDCELGNGPYDSMLLEMARTPLFRRLQSIEQLTLGPAYATMPNTTHFSRWQHIWGSLAFVRKMNENRELSDREKIVLELRTLLSDVGHTVFSHLGDWLFQDSGQEDMHDQDLKDLLSALGIEDILNRNGLSIEETVFPEIEDWVECASPDLCVDRVDYGMREIMRWGVPTIPMNLFKGPMHDPNNLFLIDNNNQLIMNNLTTARYFAAGFSLLPTEHWGHPVHRLQLELMQSSVRNALVSKIAGSDLHPRDAMYGIDADFDKYFVTWEGSTLNEAMKNIARDQRRIFVQGRRADLEYVMGSRNNPNGKSIFEPEWVFPDFPDPLEPYTWKSEYFGKPYSPALDISPSSDIKGKAMYATERGLVLELPPLKARAIDPLIGNETSSKRLSELDPSYGKYLQGQRDEMSKGYIATVLMRRDIAEKIVAQHNETIEVWSSLTQRPRNIEYLRQCVLESETPGASHSFDRVLEA